MRTAAAALSLWLASTGAAAIPNEIRAEYQLTNNGLVIGRVHESFQRRGDEYRIESVSRSEGVLKMVYDEQITYSSRGLVSGRGLQPLHFEERRTRDAKRDVEATFDWQRGVLLSRFRGEETQVPLPRQTQDRLSMMYQFMHLKPRSGPLELAMSNGRKVEQYVYRIVNEVRLATLAGDFDTWHLERIVSGPRDSRVEVWLAKDRDNFPVRVVFDDPRGLRVEQSLVALESR